MDVDAVVLGTGLTESITAAALSKAGFSVAHIDTNSYYGGDHASLTLDELAEWADARVQAAGQGESRPESLYIAAQRAKFTSVSRSSGPLPSQSRQYSISLAPTIIPSIGPLIDSLIASGVSRYGGFKLLEKVAIYDGPGSVKPVPSSKEDVFKNKELSLLEKRRLMRFLMFAAGDFEGKKELEGLGETPLIAFLRETFSLDDKTAGAIAYALAFCVSPRDATLPALQHVRQYLRSTGRYSPSPFLVGHYGGLGEIAQGFCRISAVNGATYILGRRISSMETSVAQTNKQKGPSRKRQHKVQLEDLPEHLTCDIIVLSPDYLPPSHHEQHVVPSSSVTRHDHAVARCIAIIDRPLSFSLSEHGQDAETPLPDTDEAAVDDSQPQADPILDTALLVFPPSSLSGGSSTAAVTVLLTGEGSLSAPRGKYVLYISMPVLEATSQSAEDLLRPYLNATLTLSKLDTETSDQTPVQSLFELFYIQQSWTPPTHATNTPTDIPTSVIIVPDSLPRLAELADDATDQAERIFWKAVECLKAVGCRPRRRAEEGEDEVHDESVIDSMWPPLDVVDDPSDDW